MTSDANKRQHLGRSAPPPPTLPRIPPPPTTPLHTPLASSQRRRTPSFRSRGISSRPTSSSSSPGHLQASSAPLDDSQAWLAASPFAGRVFRPSLSTLSSYEDSLSADSEPSRHGNSTDTVHPPRSRGGSSQTVAGGIHVPPRSASAAGKDSSPRPVAPQHRSDSSVPLLEHRASSRAPERIVADVLDRDLPPSSPRTQRLRLKSLFRHSVRTAPPPPAYSPERPHRRLSGDPDERQPHSASSPVQRQSSFDASCASSTFSDSSSIAGDHQRSPSVLQRFRNRASQRFDRLTSPTATPHTQRSAVPPVPEHHAPSLLSRHSCSSLASSKKRGSTHDPRTAAASSSNDADKFSLNSREGGQEAHASLSSSPDHAHRTKVWALFSDEPESPFHTMAPSTNGVGGSEGPKWKLPFGKARGSLGGDGNGGNGASSPTSATPSKGPFSSASIRGWGKGNNASRVEEWDTPEGRERAAQHIAAQQRAAASSSRIGSVIGLLDGRSDPPRGKASGTSPRPDMGFIDEQRPPPHTGSRSKLERITGETGLPPIALSPRAGERAAAANNDFIASEVQRQLSPVPTFKGSIGSGSGSVGGNVGGAPSPDMGYEYDHQPTRVGSSGGVGGGGGGIGIGGGATTAKAEAEADESQCPVCLELLSFRLAGEKPHVVPVCGHALHHACFSAVYGSPETVLANQGGNSNGAGSGRPAASKPNPPGMCGVCRRPIFLSDDNEGRRQNKLAGMMGVGGPAVRSRVVSAAAFDEAPTTPGDDPLESIQRSRSRDQLRDAAATPMSRSNTSESGTSGTCHPQIRVRPEYSTVYRKDRTGEQSRQNVVCVMTVEVPSRRPPAQIEELSSFTLPALRTIHGSDDAVMEEDEIEEDEDEMRSVDDRRSLAPSTIISSEEHNSLSPQAANKRNTGSSETSFEKHQESASATPADDDEGFSFGATPAAGSTSAPAADEPFAAVLDDLKARISDWKGHGPERFGPLIVFDYLGVRQDSVVREFSVYLFNEALLCVTEDRKKEKSSGLARFISSDKSTSSTGSNGANKTPLKLKGRIWLRHIRRIQVSSLEGDLSISIKLDDESLDHFVICFKDKPKLAVWKNRLTELLERHSENAELASSQAAKAKAAAEAAAAASSSAALTAAGTASPAPSSDVAAARRYTQSLSSGKAGASPVSPLPRTPKMAEPRRSTSAAKTVAPPMPAIPQHQQWSASGGLDPSQAGPELLPHTPLDLVVMVSVPVVAPAGSSSLSSSAALKLRLISSTIDFICSHLGPRDRVALVTYNVGTDGEVRRTALLNTHKDASRAKLDSFIESIGQTWSGEGEDPFREDLARLGGASDRTDTITAVNVGLDIVLQRKSKNPVTGMILVNDTADAPRRGQIDLVMARAEAANVPIHCFGFGKSHDPSSLWLISNHTRGSYTFVREWYQLRECVAGCLGTLMSVALSDLKLHIAVPTDNHFRVRKIAGPTGAIVSSSGKDVHVDLGVLCFGERREVLVELELDFNALVPFVAESTSDGKKQLRKLSVPYEPGSATDDFMQRLGLQGLNLSDSNPEALDGLALEQLIEEIAVFEVDASFRDPARATNVSRMPQPTVLTIEIDAHGTDPVSDLSSTGAGAAAAMADPIVTRRRMELLVSDMITRSLLLVSRKNHAQALKILTETRRIVDTVLQAIIVAAGLHVGGASSMPGSRRTSAVPSSIGHGAGGGASSSSRGGPKKQREALHRQTAESLSGILEDLDVLADGLEQSKSGFERSEKNLGAQQSMVLRDQKAFTSRTDTEWRHFRGVDNGSALVYLGAMAGSGGGPR